MPQQRYASGAEHIRDLNWSFIRQHWLGVILGLIALEALLVPWAFFLPRGIREFAAGAGAASAVWLVALAVMQATGSGTRVMGLTAEDWTTEELSAERRTGWRFKRNLRHRGGDVDHLAYGPGGVLAVETKWSRPPWRSRDRRLQEAAEQAARNAAVARSLVRSTEVGLRVDVQPIVVLWGKLDGDLPQHVAGVPILHGTALREWLRGRPQTLTVDDVATIDSGVGRWLDRSADYHERTQPRQPLLVRRSPWELLQAGWLTAVGALVTFGAIAWSLQFRPWPLAVAALAVIAALLVVMFRFGPARPVAVGGVGATVATALLLGVFVAITALG